MEINKNDIRFIKTEEAISKAFIDLLKEKGLQKISITDIINRAHINRSTFYSHYEDKYAFLNKKEDQLLNGWFDIVQSISIKTIIRNPENIDEILSIFLNKLLNYILNNKEIITLLLNEKTDSSILTKLSEYLFNFWQKNQLIEQLSIPLDYAISAISSLIAGILKTWVKNDFREQPEELSQIIMRFPKAIIFSLFDFTEKR